MKTGNQPFGLRAAVLLIVLECLSSCIVTYRGFPEETTDALPVTTMIGRMRYQITPLPHDYERYWTNPFSFSSPIAPDPIEGYLIQAFSKNQVGIGANLVSKPPSRGTFCEVAVRFHSQSVPSIIWYYITGAGFVIPYYSGETGYLVRFDVYQDGEWKKRYEYDIFRKGVIWLGLLPFVWANGYTYNEQEAFHATTDKFLRDVVRDGLVVKP